MTAVAAWPGKESTKMPAPELLEATLSTMVTSSDPPVVTTRSASIPLTLLFAVTLLRTPETTADPVGWTKIPLLGLLESIVFDTEKLLDVPGVM
jgi:hypothetical protein